MGVAEGAGRHAFWSLGHLSIAPPPVGTSRVLPAPHKGTLPPPPPRSPGARPRGSLQGEHGMGRAPRLPGLQRPPPAPLEDKRSTSRSPGEAGAPVPPLGPHFRVSHVETARLKRTVQKARGRWPPRGAPALSRLLVPWVPMSASGAWTAPLSMALTTAAPRSCELGLCQARYQQDLGRKVCSRCHVGDSVGGGDAGPGELTIPAEHGQGLGPQSLLFLLAAPHLPRCPWGPGTCGCQRYSQRPFTPQPSPMSPKDPRRLLLAPSTPVTSLANHAVQ